MDASCKLQDNIHKFKLNIYVSRILGTHHFTEIDFVELPPHSLLDIQKAFKANLDVNKPLRLSTNLELFSY